MTDPYRGKRDDTVKQVIAYYRDYVRSMSNHWPNWRSKHEKWLKENFGEETANLIMRSVRGWNETK